MQIWKIKTKDEERNRNFVIRTEKVIKQAMSTAWTLKKTQICFKRLRRSLYFLMTGIKKGIS